MAEVKSEKPIYRDADVVLGFQCYPYINPIKNRLKYQGARTMLFSSYPTRLLLRVLALTICVGALPLTPAVALTYSATNLARSRVSILEKMVRMVAGFSGFLNRKRDGLPDSRCCGLGYNGAAISSLPWQLNGLCKVRDMGNDMSYTIPNLGSTDDSVVQKILFCKKIDKK